MEPIERIRVRAREGDVEVERADAVAVEEPLELRVVAEHAPAGANSPATSFVTTMRTPGNDEELAAGLLLAEGVLHEHAELLALERPADPRIASELRANVLIARLAPAAFARAGGLVRASVMGSACGVCGRTSIERVLPEGARPLASELRVAHAVLFALPEQLRARQAVFEETGGLHAAALFDAAGELLGLREDIGRHNATDKLVGTFLLADELPLTKALLVVSGRAGFEIVQKAYSAGIPVVASVSAPSSLAVEFAEAAGVTLVGFLRGKRFNVYAHARRIDG